MGEEESTTGGAPRTGSSSGQSGWQRRKLELALKGQSWGPDLDSSAVSRLPSDNGANDLSSFCLSLLTSRDQDSAFF